MVVAREVEELRHVPREALHRILDVMAVFPGTRLRAHHCGARGLSVDALAHLYADVRADSLRTRRGGGHQRRRFVLRGEPAVQADVNMVFNGPRRPQ